MKAPLTPAQVLPAPVTVEVGPGIEPVKDRADREPEPPSEAR